MSSKLTGVHKTVLTQAASCRTFVDVETSTELPLEASVLAPCSVPLKYQIPSLESFEKSSRRPDERDPDLNIRRSKNSSVPKKPRRPKSHRGKGKNSYEGRPKARAGSRG